MLAQGQFANGSSGDPRSEDFIRRFETQLLATGALDAASLGRAKRAQAVSLERFDLVLTRLGLLSETQLVHALSGFLEIPVATARDFPDVALFPDALPSAFLRTSRLAPLKDDGDRILIAVADPFNTDAPEAISFLLKRPVERRLVTSADIDAALDSLYGPHAPAASRAEPSQASGADVGADDDVRRLEDMASEAPVIKTVQELIVRAVDLSASDIHIEPAEDGVRVRYRIDGALHTLETLPPSMRLPLSSRIKIMAKLNIAERRLPQDGRMKATARGRDIDLRVSTMPTMYGESVVLRILDRASVALDFETLGISGDELGTFLRDLAEPNGLILVTGPTGSGKTTTLYTALAKLNDVQRKVFTVEDPIEYQLQGVNQIQVNSRIGLTFATALRSMLRQDPDIILVGEIRDLETAEIAIRASLTGHLVLSTVHTNSAAATVTRLLNMGVEDYLLASSLKAVLAQRLVRRLCAECAAPDDSSVALVERLVRQSPIALSASQIDPRLIQRPVGCRACRQTGFSGRTAIYELLSVTGAVRTALVERRSEMALEAAARSEGMASMQQNGLTKVLSGVTTIEEVLRVSKAENGAL